MWDLHNLTASEASNLVNPYNIVQTHMPTQQHPASNNFSTANQQLQQSAAAVAAAAAATAGLQHNLHLNQPDHTHPHTNQQQQQLSYPTSNMMAAAAAAAAAATAAGNSPTSAQLSAYWAATNALNMEAALNKMKNQENYQRDQSGQSLRRILSSELPSSAQQLVTVEVASSRQSVALANQQLELVQRQQESNKELQQIQNNKSTPPYIASPNGCNDDAQKSTETSGTYIPATRAAQQQDQFNANKRLGNSRATADSLATSNYNARKRLLIEGSNQQGPAQVQMYKRAAVPEQQQLEFRQANYKPLYRPMEQPTVKRTSGIQQQPLVEVHLEPSMGRQQISKDQRYPLIGQLVQPQRNRHQPQFGDAGSGGCATSQSVKIGSQNSITQCADSTAAGGQQVIGANKQEQTPKVSGNDSIMKCMICNESLEENNYIQHPTFRAHKFCLTCSKSVQQQLQQPTSSPVDISTTGGQQQQIAIQQYPLVSSSPLMARNLQPIGGAYSLSYNNPQVHHGLIGGSSRQLVDHYHELPIQPLTPVEYTRSILASGRPSIVNIGGGNVVKNINKPPIMQTPHMYTTANGYGLVNSYGMQQMVAQQHSSQQHPAAYCITTNQHVQQPLQNQFHLNTTDPNHHYHHHHHGHHQQFSYPSANMLAAATAAAAAATAAGVSPTNAQLSAFWAATNASNMEAALNKMKNQESYQELLVANQQQQQVSGQNLRRMLSTHEGPKEQQLVELEVIAKANKQAQEPEGKESQHSNKPSASPRPKLISIESDNGEASINVCTSLESSEQEQELFKQQRPNNRLENENDGQSIVGRKRLNSEVLSVGLQINKRIAVQQEPRQIGFSKTQSRGIEQIKRTSQSLVETHTVELSSLGRHTGNKDKNSMLETPPSVQQLRHRSQTQAVGAGSEGATSQPVKVGSQNSLANSTANNQSNQQVNSTANKQTLSKTTNGVYNSLKCLLCCEPLEDRHFVQCPTIQMHKFCFACSKVSIQQQQQTERLRDQTSLKDSNEKVYCPSGKNCLLANERSPWTFMNNEIETIFRESSRNSTGLSGVHNRTKSAQFLKDVEQTDRTNTNEESLTNERNKNKSPIHVGGNKNLAIKTLATTSD